MNAILPDRLSAAGYAEYRPVASNATPGRPRGKSPRRSRRPAPREKSTSPREALRKPTVRWRKVTDGE